MKMKLFRNFFRHTWLYKTYNVFSTLSKYNHEYDLVSDTLYSDAFKKVLKRYLNTDFDKDWIGRLYGVINPNIDINGNINFSNTIIEIDGDNTNSNEYIKTWVYKQMQLIGELFKIEKLYDYIVIDFRHVGPKTHDNYLVVFDLSSRLDFTDALKSFTYHTILYICIAFIITGIILTL